MRARMRKKERILCVTHILQCYSEGDIGSQYSSELGVAGAQL